MILLQENKSDIDDLLLKEGVKRTKHRIAILEILEQSETPLTADEIFLILKENNTSIWLSTIYRTLEMLTEKEVVRKSTIMGEDKARYEIKQDAHKHCFVCVTCHKMIPLMDCPLEEFEEKLKDKMDFDVTGHNLEIYGYCHDCKLMKR
ncbi:Fur family transcriptional regulator [Desulfitobacterium metallireducens]|uniref:Fur family transcriptional regulator n=1 Tax=Desulfitobacterium metallireducens TaxID=142877 RepID=UPI00023146E6|nr:transcriptional repressor [Desulfitobacterium metallireducens]